MTLLNYLKSEILEWDSLAQGSIDPNYSEGFRDAYEKLLALIQNGEINVSN